MGADTVMVCFGVVVFLGLALGVSLLVEASAARAQMKFEQHCNRVLERNACAPDTEEEENLGYDYAEADQEDDDEEDDDGEEEGDDPDDDYQNSWP